MTRIDVRDGIVELNSFLSDAADLLAKLRYNRQALVLMDGGRAAGVVLSPEAYEALQYEIDFLKAIGEGLADTDRGDLIPHERVSEWLQSIGTPNELPPPL